MTSSPTASPPRTVSFNELLAARQAYYELVGTGMIESWMVRVLLAARDALPGDQLIDEEGMLHPGFRLKTKSGDTPDEADL